MGNLPNPWTRSLHSIAKSVPASPCLTPTVLNLQAAKLVKQACTDFLISQLPQEHRADALLATANTSGLTIGPGRPFTNTYLHCFCCIAYMIPSGFCDPICTQRPKAMDHFVHRRSTIDPLGSNIFIDDSTVCEAGSKSVLRLHHQRQTTHPPNPSALQFACILNPMKMILKTLLAFSKAINIPC